MANILTIERSSRTEQTISKSLATSLFHGFLCSGLIALGAQIELKLPFTPVPITGQSLSVVLAGLFFGRQIAVIGTAMYIAEGATGLPVFSGGSGGLQHIVGPTGGYLLGFVPAAYVSGYAKDAGATKSPLGVFVTVLAASIPIFSLGILRLWQYFWDLSTALTTGLIPFIPGDIIKALVASMIVPVLPASKVLNQK